MLHPIQKQFIEKWAMQCGYCTPGMIMSAKALLDVNKHPTELEIREAIEGNLCRCTGYAKDCGGNPGSRCADELGGGSKRMHKDCDKHYFKKPEFYRLTGENNYVRIDAEDKVTGHGQYVGDIMFPDMLTGKMVRSPYASAKILSIDTSEAEKLPGVKVHPHCQGL